MRPLLLVLALAVPVASLAQIPPRATAVARVDSFARAAVATGSFPGVSIAVVRGSDTLVMRGWGWADVENHVAAGAATVYRIGSVTKQFTAALVLQLAREGRLGLDDSLQQYVDFPTPGARVTLRHLLSHTSGIANYTALPEWRRVIRNDLPHDSLLAFVRGRPLEFAPGTRWRYSNTGYFLLGMVLERVTGRTYAELVRDRLTEPLGLGSTRYCDTWPIIPERAQGYEPGPGGAGIENASFISMTQPFAAGSLCSTVRDLARWTHSLATDGLLPAGSFALMSTPGRLPDGSSTKYGFGLAIDTMAGHATIGHGGGINGFSASVGYFPDDSLIVVVLANDEAANTSRLGRQAARAALGIPEAEVHDVVLGAADRARYTGTYQLGPLSIRIFERGDSLLAQATGQGAFGLRAQGAHTFLASFDPDVRLVFDVSGDRATGFTLFQGGAQHARRVD